MALKTCDRCKYMISDRAIWCPHCKELNAVIYLDVDSFANDRYSTVSNGIKQHKNEDEKENLFIPIICIICFFIFPIGIFWYGYNHFNVGMFTHTGVPVFSEELMVNSYRGDSEAQASLAYCYLYGNGVEENLGDGIFWAIKSADQDNQNGIKLLKRCYKIGFGVNEHQNPYIENYIDRAIEGDEVSQYMLGLCFQKGYGVIPNDKESYRWISKAAANGASRAVFDLGVCYLNGWGTNHNRGMAFTHFKRAAKEGKPIILYLIGETILENSPNTEEMEFAVECLTRASEMGEHKASQLLKQI